MIPCGDRTFDIGARTFVVGVVNVTPDSFSDGGRHFAAPDAYDHAMRMLDDGADVLDIGAESTRPGAIAVSEAEELRRLTPVVERLVGAGVRCISVDTSKASVARAALQLGAAWLNDVSGFADLEMIRVAADADAVVVMHQRPMSPGRIEDDVAYGDAVAEVGGFLRDAVRRAVAGGVAPDRVIIDPGLGFGKTVAHNVSLIERVAELRRSGQPVLLGPSRKRFLSALSGADSLEDRDAATLAACCAAAERGVDFVRVHRVRGVRAALAVADALRDEHRSTDTP